MNDYDIGRKTTNTKKRFEKSKKRSETWVDRQLELLSDQKAVLPVGVYSDPYLQKFHLEWVAEKVKNDRIVGLCLNCETRPDINEKCLELIKFYADKLADHKLPIYCLDLHTPRDILNGLRAGITGFGGHYALMQAQNHCALILPNTVHRSREMSLIDMRDKESLRLNTGECYISYITYIISFQTVSNSHKEPITVDSSVKLSVGYIAHLCKVGEILETILLTQHNLDQMEKFVDFVQAEDDLDAIEKLLSSN